MLATILCAAALAAPHDPAEPQIKALCDQIAMATQTRNWKKLKALSTPDFKQRDEGGKTYTMTQLTDEFASDLKGVQNLKVTYKILSLSSSGNSALVTSYWDVVGYIPAKAQKHKVESYDTETDTFKKVNGHWLESAVQIRKSGQRIDGKEVTMGTSV